MKWLPPVRILIPWVLCCLAFSVQASDAGSISQRYVAAALQGDLSGATHLFDEIPKDGSQPVDDQLHERFKLRFELRGEEPESRSSSALVNEVIMIYRRYWTQFLMGDLDAGAGKAWLEQSLLEVLERQGLAPPLPDSVEILSRTGEAIRNQGFHVINGFTPPLYDLVIWNEETRQDFSVQLTDQQQDVTVVFMNEFQSQGWSHFATFGTASTGGWAAGDALYCVSYAYELDSENFRVSFLKHESRHLADYEQYPELDNAELEYRAKLTELAYASTSLPRLLQKFTANAAPNPESPHAWASYRVVRDLYQEIFSRPMPERLYPWSVVGPDRANPAARALLERHTRSL